MGSHAAVARRLRRCAVCTGIGLAFTLMALFTPVSHACDMVPMRITGSIGQIRGVTVAFGMADDTRQPTAWQGPLRITTGAAPACEVSDEVAIAEAPVMLGDGILYVPTYSGSSNRLYAVDVKTCRVLWRSRDFDGPIRFRGDHFTLGRRRLPFDRKCRPADVAKDLRK